MALMTASPKVAKTVSRKGLQKESQREGMPRAVLRLLPFLKNRFQWYENRTLDLSEKKEEPKENDKHFSISTCLNLHAHYKESADAFHQTFRPFNSTWISCLITTVVHQHECTHAQSNGDWKPMRRQPGGCFFMSHGEAWCLGPQEVRLWGLLKLVRKQLPVEGYSAALYQSPSNRSYTCSKENFPMTFFNLFTDS